VRALASIALLLAACTGVSILLPSETVLKHPKVHMLFFGNYDVLGETTDWTDLLTDPAFLGRLAEYGCTGADLAEVKTPATPPALTVDATIPAMLDALMLAGTIDQPRGEDVYMVWLPPGETTLSMQASNSNGYHSANIYGIQWYTFAVISNGGGEDPNAVASHELYESITDPYLTGVHVSVDGAKFPDNEVADVCEGDYDVLDGVTVQQVWSEKAGACE